jgi:hypothetical protein
VENHEALGKDIHFCKDPLRYKRVHIFSWNWTHTVSATQGCASKWLQVWTIHFKNQRIPNWTCKSTHTHKHTYTHTKCWYTVRYLVRNLTSIYWIAMLNISEVTERPDTLVNSINSHSLNERFSFKDSYSYLNSGYTQWLWNSVYSKNFHKEQRN